MPKDTFRRPFDTFPRPSDTFQLPSNTFPRPSNTFLWPSNNFPRQSNTFPMPSDTFLRPYNTSLTEAEAAVRSSPLYCSVSGCRWKTPQGEGGEGAESSSQGGGGGVVHSYPVEHMARSRTEQVERKRCCEEGRGQRAPLSCPALGCRWRTPHFVTLTRWWS